MNHVVAQRQIQDKVEVPLKAKLPSAFLEYIDSKTRPNESGGRPHFLSVIVKQGRDANEILLDILEDAWLKGKLLGAIAKHYHTSYDSIWRIIKDLKQFKPVISELLLKTPRAKKWFIEEFETSDYDIVQNYIKRAKREGLKNWKSAIQDARRFWTWTHYKAPQNWSADDVHDFLATLSRGAQSRILGAIRNVAPQIRDKTNPQYVGVGFFRAKLRQRKKDLFGAEVKMILDALKKKKMKYHATVFKLHVQIGAREGSNDTTSGMVGLNWSYFKHNFKAVDDFESKVHGGIWWRNCPLDVFFPELPDELRALWIQRGRPTDEKLIQGGYEELKQVYRTIRATLKEEYEGKVDPSLAKEFSTIRCHDADKLHVNMLWEAGVPLEVVAGQYLGNSEGIGLLGRGWLAIDVIKKHYLSLTQRSHRFQRIEQNVRDYAQKVLIKGGTYDVKESEMRA